MAALLNILEGLVASGHIQYYGIESDAFTVAETSTAASNQDSTAPVAPAQPLRELFELAEALSGQAKQQRKEIVAQLVKDGVKSADVPERLGNTVSRRGIVGSQSESPITPETSSPPLSNADPDSAIAAASSALSTEHPLPDDHHLVCITYPLNLGHCDALIPTVLDRQGK